MCGLAVFVRQWKELGRVCGLVKMQGEKEKPFTKLSELAQELWRTSVFSKNNNNYNETQTEIPPTS